MSVVGFAAIMLFLGILADRFLNPAVATSLNSILPGPPSTRRHGPVDGDLAAVLSPIVELGKIDNSFNIEVNALDTENI